MRAAMLLGVLLGLQGCDSRAGIKKTGVDASTEVASQTGTDSGGGTVEAGGPLDLLDAAAFPDAAADGMGAPGTCVALTPPASRRELSVAEVLDSVESLDTSPCVRLKVTGKVFEDFRQKGGDAPAPFWSLFILQDGGDLPGYVSSAPRSYIQLYSVDDLSPTLHKQVHVTAHLRVVTVSVGNGPPAPFFYLEVMTITADQDSPDGSADQAEGSADGNAVVDLRADEQAEPRATPAGGAFELRDDPSRVVAVDGGQCSPGFIRTHALEFPAGARTVKVIPLSAIRSFPVEGSLSDTPGPVLHYILNDAAGELLVWRQGSAWFGQLTVYGSGPEAGCVRGELVFQAPL